MDYPPLETDRLRLRTLTLSDTREVFAHFSHPRVMRFITDTEPCVTPADAAEIIAFHMKDPGCRYGLFLKPSMNFIGTCGYHCLRQAPEPRAEIGYDLSPNHWGRGYMLEAMAALLEFGFGMMGLDEVEATSAAGNSRSTRLLQRLGFTEVPSERVGERRFLLRRGAWGPRSG